MINIVIAGKCSLELCDKISGIVTRFGVEETKGIITYSPELCCIDMTPRHNEVWYIIVCDTSKERCLRIAEALHDELGVRVATQIFYDALDVP